MYSCAVSSGGVSVNFFSDIDLYPHFISEPYTRFVPEYRCQAEEAATGFHVKYQDCAAERLTFTRTSVDIRFPWTAMRVGETILYLSYPFIEYQRQMQGSLTCHAASCTTGEKGVLLLGKEGAGKTTIAIHLCRQRHYRLIANDLCLLQGTDHGAQLLGGTKFFYLRQASVERSLPDLVSSFTGNGDPWLQKVTIEPTTLGIKRQDHPVPLTGAYMIHVDEAQTKLHLKRLDDLATRLHLNENFSRYIRSTCTTMLGGDSYDLLGYIPCLDEEELYVMRRNLINHLLYDLGIWYVSGRSQDIADYIANQTSES